MDGQTTEKSDQYPEHSSGELKIISFLWKPKAENPYVMIQWQTAAYILIQTHKTIISSIIKAIKFYGHSAVIMNE